MATKKNATKLAVLAGGLGLVGSGVANGAIIYTPNVNVTIDNLRFNLDIDGDSQIDIFLQDHNRYQYLMGYDPFSGVGVTVHNRAPVGLPPNFFVTNLTTSQYIPGGSGTVLSQNGYAYFRSYYNFFDNFAANFDNADIVVGVKFFIGTNSHFGWLRIFADTLPVETSKLILKEYAYESLPNTPIHAGATGSANPIPEPSSFVLMALGGVTALAYRRAMRRRAKKAAATETQA